jgi:hypothetical protein
VVEQTRHYHRQAKPAGADGDASRKVEPERRQVVRPERCHSTVDATKRIPSVNKAPSGANLLYYTIVGHSWYNFAGRQFQFWPLIRRIHAPIRGVIRFNLYIFGDPQMT